jgi:hypothetical protein
MRVKRAFKNPHQSDSWQHGSLVRVINTAITTSTTIDEKQETAAQAAHDCNQHAKDKSCSLHNQQRAVQEQCYCCWIMALALLSQLL